MNSKKKPKFSVIIGSYNTKKYLKLTLISVLNQTFKDFELIVIDDGSKDGTDKLIQQFASKDKRIRPFYFKTNSGKDSVPKNFGITKARGRYICFLDSDDLWNKDKLIIQNNYLKKDTIMLCTSCKYIDESGNNHTSFFTHHFRKILQNWFFSKGLLGFYMYNPVIFSSVMIKTEVIKKYMLNEKPEFIGIIDYELWLRLFDNSKKKIIFINEDLVKIRRRNDSLNRNYTRASIRAIHCVTKHFIEKNNFKYFYVFLLGVGLRALRTILNFGYHKLKKVALTSLFILFGIYFTIFYSPLIWHLGKPLLHYDKIDSFKNFKNIVVFSGHGDTSYYNQTYQYRYKDIVKLLSNLDEVENIFILGRLREIPEQKIIEKLLISDGVDDSKLRVIYEEFENTKKNIQNVSKMINDENIKNIIFITSPYHTKRAKLLWSNVSNLDVKIFKSTDWPIKKNFFSYQKNKKIIIYEHISILYNKILGNI